jgi:octanoyl-[GcvH]:protein N-octanoyltransferase
VKVVGTAQRVIKGAALLTGVVVVDGAEALRGVLTDVYDALGLAMDPATVGALRDAAPGLDDDAVEDALLAIAPGALTPRALDAPTLAEAQELVALTVSR